MTTLRSCVESIVGSNTGQTVIVTKGMVIAEAFIGSDPTPHLIRLPIGRLAAWDVSGLLDTAAAYHEAQLSAMIEGDD